MKIHGDKLEKLMLEKGLTHEQLAASVERTGLTGEHAVSALRNWMRGRDHPRCKADDINRMAQSLGVQPGDIARFVSVFKFHRGSPRKCKLLVDLIRGKRVDKALEMLTFTTKRAAIDVKQALTAAVSEAEQAGSDLDKLIVTESRVDNGPVLKRFQPKDRGRAHAIKKRLAHITVGVEEQNQSEDGN